MTIKEFYNWVCERNFEDFNFLIKDENGDWDIEECMIKVSIKNKEFIVT